MVCPLLLVWFVLVVSPVVDWFVWFDASGLWAFFLVLVLVGCPLLLFLVVVLVVHPVAARFVWLFASCLLVVPVLVVCAFDPWLSWCVASCGGSSPLNRCLWCMSFVVSVASCLLLLVCEFSSDIWCWLCVLGCCFCLS